MSNNPFLQKKSKKHSFVGLLNLSSKTSLEEKNLQREAKSKTLQKLKDPSLTTLNSKEKNPIIYPSELKKYIKKNKLTLSPNDLSKMALPNKKGIASFDDRLNNSSKKSLKRENKSAFEFGRRSILRWDSLSFSNKDSILQAELKNVKKHFKDKKMVKCIDNYQKTRKSLLESEVGNVRKNSATGEVADTQREDMFGNKIFRGGSKHRVSFSFKGDLKVVDNWKKLNKKLKIEPDFSNDVEDEDKKKCKVF